MWSEENLVILVGIVSFVFLVIISVATEIFYEPEPGDVSGIVSNTNSELTYEEFMDDLEDMREEIHEETILVQNYTGG